MIELITTHSDAIIGGIAILAIHANLIYKALIKEEA